MTDVSPVADERPRYAALRQRLGTLVKDWQRATEAGWNPSQASAFYDEFERLAAEADAEGAEEIASPVLELTVFLCSFVDASVPPSPAQQQGLQAMFTALNELTAPPGRTPKAARPAVAANVRGVVHYICPPARSIHGLAPVLGAQRFVVRPFDEPDAAIIAFAAAAPDVLLVDDTFVTQVHTLIEAAARTRESQRERPLCLVLAEDADAARVLYAQRAGADAVVTKRDPIAILARIEETLEQRRNLGYRVLVVEDDPVQAKFCESILHHRGVTTRVCTKTAEVLDAVHAFNPDLVLLDLYLPDGNGIDAAQAIRAEPSLAFLPVVFLSGEQDLDRRFDAISLGGDDFLTKPVKPRHLLMTVESRVRRARALIQAQGSARGERRGILSGRSAFVEELQRLIDTPPEGTCALVMVAVDDVEGLRDRVGFVDTGTLAQQVSAALAAELPMARPMAAFGEASFVALARAPDAAALRDALEAGRARVTQRAYLSSEDPLRLNFTLAAQRVPGKHAKAEPALRALRLAVASAQAAGGNRCELDLREPVAPNNEDPRLRLVRAILRGPVDDRTDYLDFQPWVPLGGDLSGQYVVRLRLRPPKASQAMLIDADEYLPIARDHGLAVQVDHRLARACLRRLRGRPGGAEGLRLCLPLTVESLLDAAFPPWLAAELRSHGVPAGAIVLEFKARELIEQQPSEAALEALQRVGARLCLYADASEAAMQRWLQHAAFSIVRWPRPEPVDSSEKAPSPWTQVATTFAGLRGHGKVVVAAHVSGTADLMELMRGGVRYAHGAVLCDWLTDFTFDFSDATM